jgi:hypothetical protein
MEVLPPTAFKLHRCMHLDELYLSDPLKWHGVKGQCDSPGASCKYNTCFLLQRFLFVIKIRICSYISISKYCLKSEYHDTCLITEFTKTTLTPLEIELRDELRKVADDMDAMVSFMS